MSEAEAAPERLSILSPETVNRYPLVNGLASLGELVVGAATGNMALGSDGAHGTVEAFVTRKQLDHAHNHDAVDATVRGRIYSVLFGCNALGASVAALEAAHIANPGIHNGVVDALGLAFAGVSSATALRASRDIARGMRAKYGSVLQRFRLNNQATPTERDVIRHIMTLDAPASSLAFVASGLGLVANTLAAKSGAGPVFEEAQSLIGLASAGWGMRIFWPSRRNIRHGL